MHDVFSRRPQTNKKQNGKNIKQNGQTLCMVYLWCLDWYWQLTASCHTVHVTSVHKPSASYNNKPQNIHQNSENLSRHPRTTPGFVSLLTLMSVFHEMINTLGQCYQGASIKAVTPLPSGVLWWKKDGTTRLVSKAGFSILSFLRFFDLTSWVRAMASDP